MSGDGGPVDLWSDDVGDEVLLAAARAGSGDAFAVLFRRHHRAAVGFAVALTRDSARANDLVSDAFMRLMDSLERGGGPDTSVLPYLQRTIRNLSVDEHRRDRESPASDYLDVLGGHTATGVDEAEHLAERTTVARAFAALPPDAREMLWQVEVLGHSLGEVAAARGATAGATGTAVHRAREALRQAYLAEHVAQVSSNECRTMVPLIPAYVREKLPPRNQSRLQAHLGTCPTCPTAVADLAGMNTHLAGVLVPALAVLGRLDAERGLAEASPAPEAAAAAAAGRRAVLLSILVALLVILALLWINLSSSPFDFSADEPPSIPDAVFPSESALPTQTYPPVFPSPPVPATSPPSTAVVPPVPPVPVPPAPPVVVPPAAPPPSVTPPYVTVARNGTGAALAHLTARLLDASSQDVRIVVRASNVGTVRVDRPGAWRCVRSAPRPGAVRLRCRRTADAVDLFSAELSFRDPARAMAGTFGFADGSQRSSFMVTAG